MIEAVARLSLKTVEDVGEDDDSGIEPKCSFEEILAEFLQRLDVGERPDPEEYLKRFPSLREPLREFFQNHCWLQPDESARESTVGAERLVGTQIGNYKIQEVLARGGMGVICRAQHQLLRRQVAIKFLAAGALASPDDIRRLKSEAEAIAKLEHPHILPIYEVGVWEDQPFLVMPLSETGDLQKRLTHAPLHPRPAACLVRDLALAVAHAHQRGVIHRDIKPANVLLRSEGGPLLADFGLAKGPRSDSLKTATGQMLGTPHYMAPEQITAPQTVGVATDIYGLGGVLYAALSGTPPHQGTMYAEIVRKIQVEDVPELTLASQPIPRDLRAVCMKCLCKEPEHRYRSAEELADDLERFLNGEPTLAGRSGTLDRLARPLRRDVHRSSFQNWGRTLGNFGLVIFVSHLLIWGLRVAGYTSTFHFLAPRLGMFVGLLLVLAYARRGRLGPTSSVERPLWSIWCGYLAALSGSSFLLWQWTQPILSTYSMAAILAGFGFFATGGVAWGGCYLMGITFIILGVVLAWISMPEVVFGVAWLVALGILARRYGRESVDGRHIQRDGVPRPISGELDGGRDDRYRR